MAFNPNPPKAEYQATAGQTNFPFLFKIYFTSDIKVYHTPISTGTTVLLIEGIDYSVVINGDDGGTVTLILVVENNDYIILERELELTRYVEYQTSGDLLAGTLNADQDYQTYLTSDQNSIKDNSLHLVQGTFGIDTEIPSPEGDKFFKWNASGTAVEYGSSSSIVVAWGNISGTLSDQTDLQSELDLKADKTYVDSKNDSQDTEIGLKLDALNPAFTGTLTGIESDIQQMTLTGGYKWGVTIGQMKLTNIAGNVEYQYIHDNSKTLEQTSTELIWGGVNVVVGNASETNVGGIKILVSDADCYITTDGSTPGP